MTRVKTKWELSTKCPHCGHRAGVHTAPVGADGWDDSAERSPDAVTGTCGECGAACGWHPALTTRAPFYIRLPNPPTEHTRASATAYHLVVLQLLEDDTAGRNRTGYLALSRGDRASLQRLEKRWRRRALGLDRRWLLVGSMGGRLPAAAEDFVKNPDAEWDRPLAPGETGKEKP